MRPNRDKIKTVWYSFVNNSNVSSYIYTPIPSILSRKFMTIKHHIKFTFLQNNKSVKRRKIDFFWRFLKLLAKA